MSKILSLDGIQGVTSNKGTGMAIQDIPNTTAKLTIIVLLILGFGSMYWMGQESKDIILTVSSGLIGFLAKDLRKTDIKSDPTA